VSCLTLELVHGGSGAAVTARPWLLGATTVATRPLQREPQTATMVLKMPPASAPMVVPTIASDSTARTAVHRLPLVPRVWSQEFDSG